MLAELVYSQNKLCMLSVCYLNSLIGCLIMQLPTTESAQEKSKHCNVNYIIILRFHG